MDFSQITNPDVQKFFRHQEANLTYKSAASFDSLHNLDPWQTYKNFKTKTHLPWMPLDLKKLGRDFPAEAILQEAKAIEHLAVAHKSDGDSSKGWKSLCLHGLGTQATLSCDEYGYKYDHETPYTWTPAAESCPITTLYFKNVFPHTRYNRLRFMYLEPGGYIAPHEDVIDPNPHFTAINIAVNQPKDCTFLMGSPNLDSVTRWGRVPFYQGGDCFWLDLRNHHSVVNLSNETRIHIIVHQLLDKNDTHNLRRFVKMFPKQDQSHLIKQKTENKKLNMVFGFWQPQIGAGQEGLQPYSELTERFAKSLSQSIELEGFVRAQTIDEILSQALLTTKADYLLFFGPGQIIPKNEAFCRELIDELTAPQNADVALWAHLIDKGDGSYLGLHPQLFCLDLKKYRSYGSGKFGAATREKIPLTSWTRSKDNVHDDYTPVFVEPLGQMQTHAFLRDGWALLSETLQAHFSIHNFSQFIRETKIHGYPEENFEALAQFRGSKILLESPQEGPLFQGQVTFLKWLKQEVQSIYTNIWVYNNESIRRLPPNLTSSPIGFIAGPAAGNWDFAYFCQVARANNFQFIHFDSSAPNLDFKKGIIYDLQQEPFQIYLLRYLRRLDPTTTVSEKIPLSEEYSYDHIRQNSLWNLYLQGKHCFIHQDIFKNPSMLIEQIPTDSVGIFNISNIFYFLPALWLYSEAETLNAFLNLLQKIEEKNSHVLILGKDPFNVPILFERVGDVLERFLKNKGQYRECFVE